MNNYTLLKPICNALYGKIYLAKEHQTNDIVAIKEMNLQSMKTNTTLSGISIPENGLYEALVNKTLALQGRLENVLYCRTQFKANGNLYLVFDYCKQGELFGIVAENLLTESKTQLYFSQIVNGVSNIHSQGFAHRDLSLENVLVNAEDECQVCDFGLAAAIDQSSTQRVGKLYYMAPEVYAGEKYDPAAADMWSLGAMLFTMLTGVPVTETPSDKDSRFQCIRSFGVGGLLKAWNLYDNISPEAIDILEQLLVVAPEQRMTISQLREHPWIKPQCIVPPTQSTLKTKILRKFIQRKLNICTMTA